MMSLRVLALERLVNTGAKIDWENPVIKDTLFDIRSRLLDLDHQIDTEFTRLEMLRRRLNFRMDTPDMHAYTSIRVQLEDAIFDEFYAVTPEQIAWSEYFHGVYDLVIVARFDRTTTLLLIVEVLKYYSVLKRPPELDLNDRLYPLVGHIEMLFRKLKEEHEKIVPSDIAAHFQRFVDFQVANRIEYQTSKKAWDELRALRARYSVLTSQP